MKPRPTVGRPAAQQEQVLSSLRREIVAGRWAPGEQLPTRLEMVSHYGVCMATVQNALDTLRRDGFIRVHGRGGTFVSHTPPHLTRFAMVYVTSPSQINWSYYYSTLQQEAAGLEQTTDWQLPQFYGVDGHDDSEDYQHLVRELKAQRVAGLIFTNSPYFLRGTPLLDLPNLARVSIGTRHPSNPCPTVVHDGDSFREKAFSWLASRGCRRVAFLSTSDPMPLFQKECERFNLSTRPQWWQMAHLVTPVAARQSMHLLFQADQRERPDALVVLDDNLLEHALAGLMAAGVRVPDDVQVVAHSNFSRTVPDNQAVKRLGYDIRELLRACIDNIQIQLRGDEPPNLMPIDAIFDHELVGRRRFAAS